MLQHSFEVTNVTVSAGTNVLTAVYHGPAFTNTQMVATDKVTVVVGNSTYTHDANGNLTGDQNFTYQYDLANRLTNVILKASNVSVFAASYDGLGRRIQVVRNGTTTERYVFLPGSFLVLAILDSSNAVKEFYTHGPDLSGTVGGAGGIGGILSVSTNIGTAAASKYFHADAMGNVILVSGPDGNQVAAYGFTPFGKLVNQVGDYQSRFLFSSKELDPETGLVLYGLRYLKPSSGRFLSRDPIEERDGPHLYAFVQNQPVNLYDLWGLTTVGEILDAFFSTSPRERLWVMGPSDEYTGRVRNWQPVRSAVEAAKASLARNCDAWKIRHITSPSWTPGRTDPPVTDPNAWAYWVDSPDGTDPTTARNAYLIYLVTGRQTAALWTSAIGSFGVYVTVDSVDCVCMQATMRFWTYNSMDRDSFGRFAHYFPSSAMARQYMWWNWTEDYNWGAGTSEGKKGAKGGGGKW